MMNLVQDLILASKSPRRQKILRDIGLDFRIETLDVDESFSDAIPVHEVAAFLAKKKNEAYRIRFPEEIIITADTTVVLHTTILNKPENADDATRMLKLLSGNTHKVVTGVSISDKNKEFNFSDIAEVTFRQLGDDEISYYIEKFRPFDKAGAYGIQEWIGMVGIEKLKGSYFTVMGLPAHKIYEILRKEFDLTIKQKP